MMEELYSAETLFKHQAVPCHRPEGNSMSTELSEGLTFCVCVMPVVKWIGRTFHRTSNAPFSLHLSCTDMRRLTTGIRSEKCVVRRFRRCAKVYLHKPRQYSLLHTQAVWCSLLLLGYKPVQHVTVLNTVGNCNTMVSIIILYYNIMWVGQLNLNSD